MTPSRLFVLFAFASLCLLGCREEPRPVGRVDAVPALSSLVARTVYLLNEVGYDSMVVVRPDDSTCVQRDSSRTVCRGESGDSAVFLSWKIDPGPQADGDMMQFVVLGRFSVSPRLRVLEIRLGHDAPFLLLWDPRTGRFANFSFNYDSVWVSTSGRTMLLVSVDKGAVHLLTEIDGTPSGWSCRIPSDSLRIDGAVLVRSSDSTIVHPDSLARFPGMRCQPDTTLWAKKLPDWAYQPAEQVSTPVLLQNSGRANQP